MRLLLESEGKTVVELAEGNGGKFIEFSCLISCVLTFSLRLAMATRTFACIKKGSISMNKGMKSGR